MNRPVTEGTDHVPAEYEILIGDEWQTSSSGAYFETHNVHRQALGVDPALLSRNGPDHRDQGPDPRGVFSGRHLLTTPNGEMAFLDARRWRGVGQYGRGRLALVSSLEE
jgi:hypothetical protein